MSSLPSLPFLIGPILTLLAGAGVLVFAFLAPKGRKALTGVAGALILVAGLAITLFMFLYQWIYEFVADIGGGRTAYIVLDVLDYAPYVLLSAGMIVLVFAATRRLPRPAAYPPRAHYAPRGPYQHGPAQS